MSECSGDERERGWPSFTKKSTELDGDKGFAVESNRRRSQKRKDD
jgi:hypothetical protein